jgi:PAS domain S-box-containing protein
MYSGLISALIAALDGADAEASLSGALALLHSHGLAASAAERVWLELRRGTRLLQLAACADTPVPDDATRALLAQLLGAALARAAERDERGRLVEHLQLLTQASFEGLIIHVDGVPVETNARLCEMLRCERDEILEPGAMERFMAPEDFALAAARIRDRVDGGFVVTLVRTDGTRFRAEFCTKQGVLDERAVRVAALRDVTDQVRTAELLRESEQRLRRILEETFDHVVTTRDGVVLDVRGRSGPFCGVTLEDMVGRSVLDFMAPIARSDMLLRIQSQAVGKYETTVMSPTGELIPVEVVSVISTLDGEPVRVAGLRDLRELRRTEAERQRLAQQVERSQRLESLGVLASGLAHDFNNLLVGMMGSAELLMLKHTAAEERAIAESILIAGERAAGLTRQMLVYAGRRELRAPEPVDLRALWSELRVLLDAGLSKKAAIELELAPDSVVMGERSTLMQVLMNLLTNASDALEGRAGRIRVSTRRERTLDPRWSEGLGAALVGDAWVVVEVRDSGVGMDEATRARIFEPFFTTKSKGHGLGLGACLGIVAAHGGRILVESVRGEGSTFSVILPATDARPGARSQTKRTVTPCRVMIIDDEALVRAHLRRLLEQHGFTVRDVDSAHAGLELLVAESPELVLLDLNMPDLDGLEVVRRLRATGARVPVVLCSGNLDAMLMRETDSGLIQAILHKPFSSDDLLDAVERAREGAASQLMQPL